MPQASNEQAPLVLNTYMH